VTNRIAFGLAVIIILLVGIDYALGLGASVYLARKFVDVLEWLAFWR
jgi:hypothetical protein